MPIPAGDPMKICVSALLLTALSLVLISPTQAEQMHLLDFEIRDQFNNVHRRSDVQGVIVLLIGSDRDGSQFNEAWGEAIHNSLSDHRQYARVSVLAYADLRGVPLFLRAYVRRKFPQEADNYVLMDWKGIIANAYNFAPKSSNVLVFAPSGALVHHATGREPSDEALIGVLSSMRKLLDEAN